MNYSQAAGVLIQRGELLPYKGNFFLWSYVPSLPLAVIFLVIFMILSFAHTWKMVQNRMWFCSPFVIGGLLEVVGFIGRVSANNATDQLMPYILQSVFLLIPPSLFAASIYMTLGRIISGLGPTGESCSIIRVRWLTKLFVIGDAFAFLVQSSGAGLMAAGDDPKMGENIVVGGLFIQIIFFGLFVAVAVVFHVRYRQCDAVSGGFGASVSRLRDDGSTLPPRRFQWEKLIHVLYATPALILIRSVFRIIEYMMGSEAYPLKNEWTLYVFDALLMAITMVIFYIWYPSEIRPYQKMADQQSIEMLN